MSGALDTTGQLGALHAEIHACRHCELAGYLTHAQPISGRQSPPDARLMIIGQAPGRLTVERDLMFGGPSGATLERWLQRAGFAPGALRREVYLTALTRCDPGRSVTGSGDRKPSPAEVALCRPYLERELALIRPRAILLVGGMAISAFLGSARLDAVIGATFERDGRTLIPLPHPSGVSRWMNHSTHQTLVEQALARLGELRAGWEAEAAGDSHNLLLSLSADKTTLRESTSDE